MRSEIFLHQRTLTSKTNETFSCLNSMLNESPCIQSSIYFIRIERDVFCITNRIEDCEKFTTQEFVWTWKRAGRIELKSVFGCGVTARNLISIVAEKRYAEIIISANQRGSNGFSIICWDFFRAPSSGGPFFAAIQHAPSHAPPTQLKCILSAHPNRQEDERENERDRYAVAFASNLRYVHNYSWSSQQWKCW